MKKNVSTLLASLLMVWITSAYCSSPALARHGSGDSTFTKHYVAQSQSGEEQQNEESDSGQTEESGQGEDVSQSESGDQSEGSGQSSGGGSGERVGLATLFVQAIGIGLLIVFVLSLSISSTFLFCGLVWKIGMVARGGKKPDIG